MWKIHMLIQKNCNMNMDLDLLKKLANDYDAVIITVPHNEYNDLDDAYFTGITKPMVLIADLKGIYRNKIKSRNYWSL